MLLAQGRDCLLLLWTNPAAAASTFALTAWDWIATPRHDPVLRDDTVLLASGGRSLQRATATGALNYSRAPTCLPGHRDTHRVAARVLVSALPQLPLPRRSSAFIERQELVSGRRFS